MDGKKNVARIFLPFNASTVRNKCSIVSNCLIHFEVAVSQILSLGKFSL